MCPAVPGMLLDERAGAFGAIIDCSSLDDRVCHALTATDRPAQQRWHRQVHHHQVSAYLGRVYGQGSDANFSRFNFMWNHVAGRNSFNVSVAMNAWKCKRLCRVGLEVFAPLNDAIMSPALFERLKPEKCTTVQCILDEYLPRALKAFAATPNLLQFPGFFVSQPMRAVPDHTWVEVMRLARFDDKAFLSAPSSQSDRCTVAQVWFWLASGSGIWWNTGRSLRVFRKSDPTPSCAKAVAQGFDSIQTVGWYGVPELVDCRGADRPDATRSWEAGCAPPHVELRVGLPPASVRFAPALVGMTGLKSTDHAVSTQHGDDHSCRCRCDMSLEYLNCAPLERTLRLDVSTHARST